MVKLLIQGAVPHGPSGTPFPRLELRQFVAKENILQFSLYIQALRAMYRKPASNKEAFYQLGGIHGRPYVDWNESPCEGKGYCVHNTIRFSTWHRTTTVLFEQEVQKQAIQIAGTYPGTPAERAKWQSAAESLRQPYWGWDAEETFIPPDELYKLDKVDIITPTGKQSVPNPLLGYPFREGEIATFPCPFNGDSHTLRSPNWDRTKSQPDVFIANLEARRNDIIGLTRQLYSISDFEYFNHRLENDGHSRIHAAVGGIGGHMDSVPVSGFDIAFFFLHSQVDRILTRWHSIHKGWPTGEDGRKGLPPFWRSQNDYWPPVDIKETRTFSYSYPPTLERPWPWQNAGKDLQEWVVRIKTNPFDVGGSFSILFFFGKVPPVLPSPTKWSSDPTFVGVFDVFSNSEPDDCPNCKKNRDTVIEGHVRLDKPLLEKARLPSLDEQVVEKHLTDNLNWVVQKSIDGSHVGFEKIPSLEVTIVRKTFSLPLNAEIPVEGKPKFYHNITRGKKGGYSGNI